MDTTALHITAITESRRGPALILHVPETTATAHGDLSAVIERVTEALEKGERTIVIAFTPAALLFTRSIAALVRCYSLVDDYEGTLGVVAPNPHFLHALQTAGIDTIIKTYSSEELIPLN